MRLNHYLVALMFAGSAFKVHAGLISGEYVLDNGKHVALQGLQWMPLTYTANMSRSDIETGFTDHFGNSWLASDWRYATRAETETLINSLWDETFDGWSNENSFGASWFLREFGGLGYDIGFGADRIPQTYTDGFWVNLDFTRFFFGAANECAIDANLSCEGRVFNADLSNFSASSYNVNTGTWEQSYEAFSGSLGWLSERYGGNFGFDPINETRDFTFASSDFGSLLVRNAPAVAIPEPGTLSLFVLAWLGLAARHFRRS